MDVKTVKISLKKSSRSKGKTKQVKNNLEDQAEIKKHCLRYFYSCWIKCVNKTTGDYNPGGFLTKIDYDIVYLRTVHRQELIEFNINEYEFYVKRNNEHYLAMQEIETEKEKIKIKSHRLKVLEDKERILEDSKKVFEKEKTRFDKTKYKFYKLFQDGRVKII